VSHDETVAGRECRLQLEDARFVRGDVQDELPRCAACRGIALMAEAGGGSTGK
jgi:hypothetical protein